MIPLETRGNLRVWLAPDGSQLVLRDGLVIETRGLGSDLVASTQTETLAALAGAGGSHSRQYQLTNDLDQRRTLDLTCRIESRSPQTLSIVERDFATQYVRQSCEAPGLRITNEFWHDPKQPGRIWQSRQWLGPQNGYVRLRLLRP